VALRRLDQCTRMILTASPGGSSPHAWRCRTKLPTGLLSGGFGNVRRHPDVALGPELKTDDEQNLPVVGMPRCESGSDGRPRSGAGHRQHMRRVNAGGVRLLFD
jgi:hypothetical protein